MVEAIPTRNRWGKLLALRMDFSEVIDLRDPDSAFYVDDLGAYNW